MYVKILVFNLIDCAGRQSDILKSSEEHRNPQSYEEHTWNSVISLALSLYSTRVDGISGTFRYVRPMKFERRKKLRFVPYILHISGYFLDT